ncbi:hypothetical protein VOLCADRAFT_105027 [Volvox carteri f. nagariensis]|uniref:FAS1 domain-containing protein n=1 Tax=Volvox carteri f. nagariensis TaxID=3068 RepID=D8TXW0_VOLCA|nr:uncharacterized protein VOLCADRAFT_105027 [Volvox carteri f. nagariensis]EFJ47714.1 hypothetical protein VOLCADRAFT_105027 [Volvox carteri f. nagariensis]|eukprot:XP_002951185.1 hypothetical protein VOLCADRAFT_105027 [Volvox carteri f. nagariensis]
MLMHGRVPTLILAGLLISLATGTSAQPSIYSALNSTANATFFYSSLSDANLATVFSNTSLNLTLLVPSDAAFGALETQLNISGDLFFLPNLAPKAAPILLYHFVTPSTPSGSIPPNISSFNLAFGSSTLKVNSSVVGNSTVNSTVIRISSIGSDVNITRTDISAGNSTIHILDGVLLPFYISIGSGLSRNKDLSAINSLTNKLGNNTAFLNVLNNLNTEYTVLAPVNSGLPLSLVKNGSVVTVVSPTGNATILSSFNVGLTGSGSYRSAIHLISQILLPPTLTTVREALSLRNDTKTFISVFTSSGSSYASWLDSTSLSRSTLLVPTDTAFATLLAQYPGYTLQNLIAGSTGVSQLLDLLVIRSSTISLAGLANGITNITVNNGAVLLRANKSSSTGAVKFLSLANSANSVGSDYYIGRVESGVTVIIIDTVLLPQPFNMGADGASSLAAPSPFAMAFCSVIAAALLHAFGRQW